MGTRARTAGKGKAIQDPNDILFTFYIPVEDSWQAVGSVIHDTDKQH